MTRYLDKHGGYFTVHYFTWHLSLQLPYFNDNSHDIIIIIIIIIIIMMDHAGLFFMDFLSFSSRNARAVP
jgi:hypothetical protein